MLDGAPNDASPLGDASRIGADSPVAMTAMPVPALGSFPSLDARVREKAPTWMDVTRGHFVVRRGASRSRSSGLPTLLFFGGIIAVVGSLGFVGMTVWGPEKTVARERLATAPPAPSPLPELAHSSDAPEVLPVPTEPQPVSVTAAASKSMKKGKRAKPSSRKAP